MASRRALLLIDFFNPTDFDGKDRLLPRALEAAKKTAVLKARLRRSGVPVIYANDNFGRWESEFSALVATCAKLRGSAGAIARLLAPQPGDRSILKPRHSAFYGTPLEFLLDELQTRTLILTGVAADACVSITAQEAHIRKFKLWVPSDCVASQSDSHTRAALVQLHRTTKASIAPGGAHVH